jgi:PPOX class probable F420-dependent enzyme
MLIFMMNVDTAKAKHIARDPRVALCVDDQQPPYSFVMLEGLAATSPNPPEMLEWSTRIAERYMGAALAEAFGKRNAVEGELLVRVTITKVIAVADMAD